MRILLMLGMFALAAQAQYIPMGFNPGSGGATVFTLIQSPYNNGSSCYYPATTCAVSMSPNTAAGDLVIAICAGMFNDGGPGTCAAPTGESGWSHCTACALTVNSPATGNTFWHDAYYTLSAAGGASSITCNSNAGANAYGLACMVYQFHRNVGTWTFVGGANGGSANCGTTASTTCPGATLTLGSGAQLALQFISGGQNSVTAVSGSYVGQFGSYSGFTTTGFGSACWIGASSGTAPNWTQGSAVAAVGGMVFD